MSTEVDGRTVTVDRNALNGSLSMVVDGERVGISYLPVIWNTLMYVVLFVLGYAIGVGWV